MMKKILYSPGYGAGWSTWNDDKIAKFMCEYQPIIDALEANKPIDSLVIKLQDEIKEKFNINYVCVAGADQLKIYKVFGSYKVRVFDGSESVVTIHDDAEWFY